MSYNAGKVVAHLTNYPTKRQNSEQHSTRLLTTRAVIWSVFSIVTRYWGKLNLLKVKYLYSCVNSTLADSQNMGFAPKTLRKFALLQEKLNYSSR